jgi:tetratricopeptide (TPR) repeat protein
MLSIIRQLLFLLITRPASFCIQLWEALEEWLRSRFWKKIALATLPLLLLSGLPVLVLWGYAMSSQSLTNWYAREFQIAVDSDKVEDKPSSVDSFSVTAVETPDDDKPVGLDLADLTSRRLLTLQPSNEIARFYVAQGMYRSGLVFFGKKIIRELAPDDRIGYPPAHAWIVDDLIKTAQQQKAEIAPKSLLHHVKAACESTDVDARMLVFHAALLDNEGKRDEALSCLQRAANKDQKYWVDVAKFSRRMGKNELSLDAAKNALNFFSQQLAEAKEGTPFEQLETMRVQIAISHALLNNHDKAIDVLMQGLRKDQPCVVLRSALSNAHLARYQYNLERLRDPLKVGLEDIESAMSWNPSNAQVADLVSQLMVLQAEQKEKIGAMLREQIRSGEGAALTHVLLANEAIIDGKNDEALPHLEIAYLHFPNALNVLNNLSLVLATTSKPDLVRAQELIDKAVTIGGESTELMDTRGQILAIAGKDMEAIRSFEKSIALAPGRIRTRERLITLYEKVGFVEMIAPQQAAIENIKLQIQQAEARRKAEEERARRAKAEAGRPKIPPYCQRPEAGSPPEPPR